MIKIKNILMCLIMIQVIMTFGGCGRVSEEIPDKDVQQAVVSVTDFDVTDTVAEHDSNADTLIQDGIFDDKASETEFSENIISEDITSEENGYEETQAAVTEAVVSESDIDVTEALMEYEGAADSDGEVTEIQLTFYSVSLFEGDVRMPIVTMYPENAPDKSEIWTSSDTAVATVDDIGNITAVSEGSCRITVQSAVCPDVQATVDVTVKKSVTEPVYIDGILVVNKTYALPKDYNPGVDSEASAAFEKMRAAAADEGLNIYISSGFRSYEYQKGLYERYVKRSGQAEADRYSARPGHSEHQTGLAFDLNTIDDSFADTDEYKWVKKHCAEYGFIIRYPENKESVTGYMYEPWHLRYLGVETAVKVYESGLTLEEYLGIDSKYDD